ncbi:MAG: DUF4363 family protein [Clostridia bacterium]|nr:DUF4363 family protein [Clostridia bacterium]
MRDKIIIIIVLFIIIGSGIFMQRYIKSTSEEMVDNLKELKSSIKNSGEINENIKKQAEGLYDKWQELEKKWSMFVLHDELDLIETSLVSMKANVESQVIDMSVEEIDKSIFLLEHIYEKERFCLKNIF